MDYKNRIPGYRPPRPPRKKSRAGLWAMLAVVASLVAVAIGWAVTRPKDDLSGKQEIPGVSTSPLALPDPSTQVLEKKPDKPDPKAPAPKPDAKPEQAEAPKPVEPRFTFYKILPEKEAIVPESEIKQLKHEESLGKKPTIQYLLQAGSFSNPQDAEKLKARLSALKIKSHIENVKIENANWNRVKIGPFTSLADADRVRGYLKSNQIDSVVQKAR